MKPISIVGLVLALAAAAYVASIAVPIVCFLRPWWCGS